MWLVRSLLLVSCLALLGLPVHAGTAEDPELSDPEKDVAYSPLHDGAELPYLDVTAVWITPAQDGLITLSIHTVDNSALTSPPSDRHISCAMTLLFQDEGEETSRLTATYRVGGSEPEARSTATWKPPAGPNGGGAGTANIDHNFSIEFESPGLAEFQFDAPMFVGWGGNITYIGATCNRDLYTVLAHNTEQTRDRDEASAEVKLSTADYRYVKEPAKPRPSESSPAAPAGGDEKAAGSDPAGSTGPDADVDSEESPMLLAPFVLAMLAVLVAVQRRRQ